MHSKLLIAAAVLLLSGILPAQQASWTTAPTLPSEGHWVLRETAYVKRHETPLEGRRTTRALSSRLSYGLDGERAVFLDAPLRGIGRHHGPDLGDVAVGWKWRFHQENPGPVDTVRASLSLGATLPAAPLPFPAPPLPPLDRLRPSPNPDPVPTPTWPIWGSGRL